MGATDARPVPRKNVACRVYFPILDADGDFVTGAASLDSEVSIDGAAFADCTNEATEIGSTGLYYLDLTSGEMNGDAVIVQVKTATSGAKTTPIFFYPEEVGDFRVNVEQLGGSAIQQAGGYIKASVDQILGTAFTEGAAGRISAAFKQFFNIASPAATMDHGILVDTVTTLTNAPSDSSGVTTLLSRLSAARAAYLDNLSAGAVALASTLSTLAGKFTGITLLAEWLGLIAGKQAGNSTARTELRATGAGSGTFDETTDSQEALRDRGDAAWTTGSAAPTAVQIRQEIDANSTKLDATVSSRLPTSSYTAPPSAATNASAVRTELATELARMDVAISTRLASLSYTAPLDAAGIRSAIGIAAANLDTQLDALPTNAELAAALAAADDATLAAVAALATAVAALPTATQNADALLKRDMSAVTGEASRSLLNAIRFIRNKWTIAGGVLQVFKEDDTTEAWTGAATQTAGNPVSEIDPA